MEFPYLQTIHGSGMNEIVFSESHTYEEAQDFAEAFIRRWNFTVKKRIDAAIAWLWDIEADAARFVLAYDDYPCETSLSARRAEDAAAIESLYAMLARDNYPAIQIDCELILSRVDIVDACWPEWHQWLESDPLWGVGNRALAVEELELLTNQMLNPTIACRKAAGTRTALWARIRARFGLVVDPPEHHPFLHEILATEDNTPLRIYADWLEERGDERASTWRDA